MLLLNTTLGHLWVHGYYLLILSDFERQSQGFSNSEGFFLLKELDYVMYHY